MPRACSICVHPQKVAINRFIREGGSKRGTAERFSVGVAAVWRHRTACLDLSSEQNPNENSTKGSAASEGTGAAATTVRFGTESDRCESCATLFADPSPGSLIKRAERVLHLGEMVMRKAIDDEDSRLVLQALDRVQRSLDQLLKVHGLLSDGGVTVSVDGRRQLAQVLMGVTADELRTWIAKLTAGGSTSNHGDREAAIDVEAVAIEG